MIDVLAALNPEQRQAVEITQGPVLILAGPGSGKTRVITHRIAYLIKTRGISPYRIMAVTFTNKAAREMVTRLNQLVSSSVKRLTIGTFHAICARILRNHGSALGIDPKFVIYDADDQISVIKRSLKALNLDPKQYPPRVIASAITAAKNQLVNQQDYALRSSSYFEEIVARIYEHYQQLLTESGALDFDDLLMKTVLLFRNHPEILAKYQERYLYIQVDEFQDTNLTQYELIKQLGGKHRNVCVVGDPDQSIYSWRSADLRNILSFEKDYPEAKTVLLGQNYRSTRKILETASYIISANQQRKPKELWTNNKPGTRTVVVETYTEQEEAQFVVNEIDHLVRQERINPGNCAVLYRTNAQSRVLEEAFLRYGVPYKLVAGTRFYERREIKDIIAYLRLIQNHHDSVSILRIINVPGRGIGQQSQFELSRWARDKGISEYEALLLLAKTSGDNENPFTTRTRNVLLNFLNLMEELAIQSQQLDLLSLFDMVTERTGYKDYILGEIGGDERWENILELRSVVAEYRDLPPLAGLAAFLEGVALVSDVDGLDDNVNAVTLITLHQAKGLEFPVVFIVGMEDGILPHIRSFDDPEQLEEERRLCYVGITRAKQRVYLVRAFQRNLMGSRAINKPSRFLADIPPHLTTSGSLQRENDAYTTPDIYSPSEPVTPQPDMATLPTLQAGEHVCHPQFGNGIVVSLKPAKDDTEVVIAFRETGIKRLLLSFAKLEKIE